MNDVPKPSGRSGLGAPAHTWRERALVAVLITLPLIAITSDLGSGPMRAFTVLPYLFATLGCYWTRSTNTVLVVSCLSLLLLSLGTWLKGADQFLFYMNRAQFALTIVICAFITQKAIKSRIATVQQSLASVLGELRVGLAIFDNNQVLVFANAAMAGVWPSQKSGDLQGLPLAEVLYGLPSSGQTADIKEWLAEESWRLNGDAGPLELRLTDGRFYQIHAQPLERGQTALLLHDISRLKSYQAQAVQASKLALVGELSTSLAHEINQPLAAIQLTADNIKRHLDTADEVDKAFVANKLARVKLALERARKTIDHLRRFGRNAKEQPAPVDLGDSINSALDLLSDQLIAAGIQVNLRLPEHKVFVMGHPIQLEQVLLNLMANARDAVSEGIDQPSITISLREAGGEVQCTVADNGPGVPDAIKNTIFDPFYTTKAMGRGTGLGLSVSRGIVVEFGGSLELDSSSHGATFILRFPSKTGA